MIVDYKSVARLRELYDLVKSMIRDCEVSCVNDVRDIINSKSYEPFKGKKVEVNGDGSVVELVFDGKYVFNLVDYSGGLFSFSVREVCFYKDGEQEDGRPHYVAVYM